MVCLCLHAPVLMAQIVVDGILDEPEWANARVIDQFVTTEPLSLEPAKYHTQVLLLTNESGIFVGFRNHQPEGVRRIQRRFPRDSAIAADRNVVGIDFDGTGLSGYDFTVGASNSQQDGMFGNDNTWSPDWDGNWYSQTSQDAEYWYSEFHIPWTVAPMSRARNGAKDMAFFFSRVLYDESLRFAWPGASFNRPTFLSDWQALPVEQVTTSTLDWFPYLSAQSDLENDEEDMNAGLDVVWRPDSSTQLTGSIKPDFAQVENDDLVVNFSAVEVFLAEQRPFFTENQALFTLENPLGDLLLYTRRIGARVDSGEERITDINLAGKATHYGSRLDLGVFAVSEDDEGNSEGGDYLSTRVQGRLTDSLTLGHSLTYADRPTLEREAMVNAIDMDWQSGAGMRVRGQWLYSDVTQDANVFNGQQAQDQQDQAGWLEWRYAPTDTIQYQLNATVYGDEFEMNDMGFLQENNLRELYGQVRHDVNVYPETSRLRSSWTEYDIGYRENTDGDRLPTWADVEQYFVFQSTRELSLTAGYQLSSYDDLITRGNGQFKMEEQLRGELKYFNPRGGRFTYEASYSVENSGTDEYTQRISVAPQFYINDQLTLNADFSYSRYEEWLLWDFTAQQLATYETDFYEVEVELDWYPSSRQEVRLKFQWTGVQADGIEGYGLRSSGRLDQGGRPVDDFSVSDTALQLRYRYEFAPLSDFYLVYTRGGLWDGDDTGDDLLNLWQSAWDEVTVEVISAKIRYRF